MKKTITTYKEAVNFIMSLANTSSLKTEGIDVARTKLLNVRKFLNFLGNPEKKLKVIHIAGTSGKGSTTMMLHNIFYYSGKKVGSYTSPHTTTFLERIKIGNKYISEKDLINFTNILKDRMNKFIEIGGSPISFFEFSFCLAIFAFAKKGCSVAVIETGCGGRYDSSNVIKKPIYTIITNIGNDHLDIFKTMKNLVYEKAGIIKKGIPFLTGETNKKWLKVFEKEYSKKIKIIKYQNIKIIKMDIVGTIFKYKNREYKLKLLGEHQIKNALLAIECAEDLNIKYNDIKKGLLNTFYPARMEVINTDPFIILDGAHNEDKLLATLLFFKKQKVTGRRYLIFTCVKNKDIKNIIPQFKKYFDIIYLTRFNTPFKKCADLSKLAKNKNKIYYKNYSRDALEEVLTKINKNDFLVITGSIFLAGELREHWYSSENIVKKRWSF